MFFSFLYLKKEGVPLTMTNYNVHGLFLLLGSCSVKVFPKSRLDPGAFLEELVRFWPPAIQRRIGFYRRSLSDEVARVVLNIRKTLQDDICRFSGSGHRRFDQAELQRLRVAVFVETGVFEISIDRTFIYFKRLFKVFLYYILV